MKKCQECGSAFEPKLDTQSRCSKKCAIKNSKRIMVGLFSSGRRQVSYWNMARAAERRDPVYRLPNF